MMDALPCPFCGFQRVEVVLGEGFRWRRVQCQECGALGPEVRIQTLGAGDREAWGAKAKTVAIEEWNKRHPNARSE